MVADLILQCTALLLAGVMLWRAEPALNRMSRCTPFLVRLAFLLIAVGALALGLSVLSGRVPDVQTVLIAAGVAALLVCERRLRVLLPRSRPPGVRHDHP